MAEQISRFLPCTCCLIAAVLDVFFGHLVALNIIYMVQLWRWYSYCDLPLHHWIQTLSIFHQGAPFVMLFKRFHSYSVSRFRLSGSPKKGENCEFTACDRLLVREMLACREALPPHSTSFLSQICSCNCAFKRGGSWNLQSINSAKREIFGRHRKERSRPFPYTQASEYLSSSLSQNTGTEEEGFKEEEATWKNMKIEHEQNCVTKIRLLNSLGAMYQCNIFLFDENLLTNDISHPAATYPSSR